MRAAHYDLSTAALGMGSVAPMWGKQELQAWRAMHGGLHRLCEVEDAHLQETQESPPLFRGFSKKRRKRDGQRPRNCTGRERRTLRHMSMPIAEILNTEGPGARTLQLESLHW